MYSKVNDASRDPGCNMWLNNGHNMRQQKHTSHSVSVVDRKASLSEMLSTTRSLARAQSLIRGRGPKLLRSLIDI